MQVQLVGGGIETGKPGVVVVDVVVIVLTVDGCCLEGRRGRQRCLVFCFAFVLLSGGVGMCVLKKGWCESYESSGTSEKGKWWCE
ncbi:MAG: hypothetical protein JOS17DRAFT_543524 [Linnemannia elongata]|nr:MAG: hypothetical protein JOS17DRAFT_543524 [Linnemannia elongata]